MSVNDLSFNQISTLLTDVLSQATGKTVQKPTNTAEFVSVASTALKLGVDPVLNAITQVVGRTIFSIRPYSRKFGTLEKSAQKWGYITRKLSISDKNFEDCAAFNLPENGTVDMYKVNKPEILQTNFYGSNVYQKPYTIYKDQLDCAFRSPDEFAQFMAMVSQNNADMLDSAKESLARATVANLIGGVLASEESNGRVVHLLTEYNDETGLELTKQSVLAPDNFKPFMQWVFARVASISSMMTERTQLFHTNVTGKPIMRHTPLDKQKVYLYAPTKFQSEARALADTYHDNYLKFADHEIVNFWQSLDKPDTICVQPSYLKKDGTIATGAETTVSNIFGVIFDEEAAGYNTFGEESALTPYNARGRYWNQWHSANLRFFNDFTENAVVLLLD